ncbi:hypothetical protein DMB38_00335 [Streptomyces sp. WAC 06738]|nr:hypothetical protein [Streptomyces sp. WAC 06738]AZM44472.1 hypothetical protein DMB38_00335 [Streptomyces sp. WAC 06738]
MTCLHGSGRELGHAVVERAVERAAGVSDTAPLPIGPPVHVLVVHTGRSANLRWSADGAARRERVHSGEALINPAGWASRPRWQEAEREIFSAVGRMDIETVSADGRLLVATYTNTTWESMHTRWTFTVTGGKISPFQTGQP